MSLDSSNQAPHALACKVKRRCSVFAISAELAKISGEGLRFVG